VSHGLSIIPVWAIFNDAPDPPEASSDPLVGDHLRQMPRMTVVDGLAESLNRLHVSFGPVALVARPSVFGEMAIQFDHQSVPTNLREHRRGRDRRATLVAFHDRGCAQRAIGEFGRRLDAEADVLGARNRLKEPSINATLGEHEARRALESRRPPGRVEVPTRRFRPHSLSRQTSRRPYPQRIL